MEAIKIWYIEGYASGLVQAGFKTKKEAIEELKEIKRFDEENGISDQYVIDYEYV